MSDEDRQRYGPSLRRLDRPVALAEIRDSIVCQDVFAVLDLLPRHAFDLVFADPPYNLTKAFNKRAFTRRGTNEYQAWLESWLPRMRELLTPEGSVYVCGDWRSSAAIHRVLERHFVVRNRITWEREKGRGAKSNWKNNSEDLWFATVSDKYTFNVNAVKLKRRVMAPYTDRRGRPKDWSETDTGRHRITYPSNIWTDLTVPFWSMPENTDHPTQKPEKLLAKVILASSSEGDVVFDPFLGSGTTSVVASKLGRHYVGVEIDLEYCCLARKRLEFAETDRDIQGYTTGVFWERNTLPEQGAAQKAMRSGRGQPSLFQGLSVAESASDHEQ